MSGSFAEASRFLSHLDEDWNKLITQVGPCMLQPQVGREPYEALVRAIAYQQLHGKAAEAILNRMLALYPHSPFPTPQELLATDEPLLRSCGFSASKIASIRGIALGAVEGKVPSLMEAKTLGDERLIARLVALRGVGRWTVEMLLIFSLGRPDVLPVDDFGIREGWRVLKKLPEQPKPKVLAGIGQAWSPYRSVAAWYLWRAAELAKKATAPYPNPVA
jgi:DNA-3-methyladenine glycosylase II